MTRAKMRPLMDPGDIPPNMTEAEALEFWDTHEVTEQFLQRAGAVPDEALPPARASSTHVALRIPDDTLRRVKALARKKGRGYQTLIKEFLVERLYEEEKREGMLEPAQRP